MKSITTYIVENKQDSEKKIYRVPLKEKKVTQKINPRTNRLKKFKTNRYLETTIPPEEREFKNIPKYANGKPKVRFQDWLEITRPDMAENSQVHSVGKAANGKWYGWSHRAVYGFKIGDIIKSGSIGNKYKETEKFEPYEIKTEKEAMEHAIRFAKNVS